jgi:FAD/FMN-containing dehydrogenase
LTSAARSQLTRIVGTDNVTDAPVVLKSYAGDRRLFPAKSPALVLYPRTSEEVHRVVKLANRQALSLVPVSSGPPRIRGDTVPKVGNTVMVDLSRMNRLLRVDPKNRVVMVEPGFTFDALVAAAPKHGLRPLMPLLPRSTKSVIASALDREPVTIPRYHWDASDPLLCTEVVFGSGDLFRTGAAAGPGSLEDQWASGQAQKNPLGPSQFDPFRIIQGSQGSMGVVTWATIKCEALPKVQRAFLAGADSPSAFQDFMYAVLKRRLGDHLFILNRMNLAAILQVHTEEIQKLRGTLPEWVLVFSISGHGNLPKDEIEYVEGDVLDTAYASRVQLGQKVGKVTGNEVLQVLDKCSPEPYWKLRLKSGCQEIFFLTTLDKTAGYATLFSKETKQHGFSADEIGVYIQPLVQGSTAHCEFDLFYNPEDADERDRARSLYSKASQRLLEAGVFFSRPHGSFAREVYAKTPPATVAAFKAVKAIFDPHNVMNPGTLCFPEAKR